MHHRGQAARGAASEERVRGEMAPKVRVGLAERAGQEEPFLVPRGWVEAAVPRWAASAEHVPECWGVSPSLWERLGVSRQELTSASRSTHYVLRGHLSSSTSAFLLQIDLPAAAQGCRRSLGSEPEEDVRQHHQHLLHPRRRRPLLRRHHHQHFRLQLELSGHWSASSSNPCRLAMSVSSLTPFWV